jgi:hypothetical protein
MVTTFWITLYIMRYSAVADLGGKSQMLLRPTQNGYIYFTAANF